MISRPSWEKPLRSKLGKWRKRRFAPRWLVDQAGTIFVLFVLQCLLAHGGEDTLGIGGGGTGIGAVSGLIGALLAMSLRSRWQEQRWLLDWTPATPEAAWKLRTREHLPAIFITVVFTLLFSCLAAGFNDETSILTALAAAALSMGCGFMLAGGRISTGLLYAGVILIFFYTVMGGWLGIGEAERSMRMAKGTGLLWLPILPWSLATHGTPAPEIHVGILIVALSISLYEWRRAWSDRTLPAAPPRDIMMPASSALEEFTEEEGEEQEEAAAPPHEEQRHNVRQHVAFAWFGMAGYVPDGPLPRFERLLWRWLSPRQRFLSCLGSQQAFEWFPRTRWTVGTLILMVMLALIVPRLDESSWIDDYGFWTSGGFLGLGVIAAFSGWPGRDSSFQSWLDLMHTADLGPFPSLSVMPVTTSEWIGAFAKEWTIRSAWLSSLWSAAILLGLRGVAPGIPFSWQVAFAALPWLLLAAWFPLSVLYRLVRATSGPLFQSHDIARVLPALACGFIGHVAMMVVFVGIGTREFILTAASLAIAALLGALSVWLTSQRCRSMKLDIKPKPLV
ncbi:hypothetical protein [Luteolibacter soli]|uniref:ABC transporter permease n=1 Tax=Luteolibacter soli TaxID=3135280 RepID=A0ABU9B1D9_9BACT